VLSSKNDGVILQAGAAAYRQAGICYVLLTTPHLVISPSLKKHSSENLPCPLFAKEGKFLPFAKRGREGLEGRCPGNHGKN